MSGLAAKIKTKAKAVSEKLHQRNDKSTAVPEDGDVMMREQRLDVDTSALKEMQREFSKEADRLRGELDAIDNRVTVFDNVAKSASNHDASYEDAVRKQKEHERDSAAILRQRLDALEKTLIVPLRTLVDTQLSNAKKAHKKLKETRLKRDRALRKHDGVSSPSSSDASARDREQEKVREAELEYNEAKAAFERQIEMLESEKKRIFTERLPEYRREVASFHKSMSSRGGDSADQADVSESGDVSSRGELERDGENQRGGMRHFGLVGPVGGAKGDVQQLGKLGGAGQVGQAGGRVNQEGVQGNRIGRI